VLFPAASGVTSPEHFKACGLVAAEHDMVQGKQQLQAMQEGVITYAYEAGSYATNTGIGATVAVEGGSAFSGSPTPPTTQALSGLKRKLEASDTSGSYRKQPHCTYPQTGVGQADGKAGGAEGQEGCLQLIACSSLGGAVGKQDVEESKLEHSVKKLVDALVAATAPEVARCCKHMQKVGQRSRRGFLGTPHRGLKLHGWKSCHRQVFCSATGVTDVKLLIIHIATS
jgi:hypothetical protein